jgi:hypothetical protein
MTLENSWEEEFEAFKSAEIKNELRTIKMRRQTNALFLVLKIRGFESLF